MRFLSLLAATFLPGCTAFQIAHPRDEGSELLDLPALWKNAGSSNEGRVATVWLATFQDPQMEALVDEALRHNWDLKAAVATLRVAREGAIIGRSARLPSIGASVSGSRTRSEADDEPANYATDYGLSLNTSWEVDLWGRLRDLDRAAYENYLAARADFRGARLSLAANTARAWYNLITARQQVTLALETLDSFVRNFRIVERNYKAGDDTSSALDVQFSGNNVASAERSLIARQLALDEAARTLERLLGRYPSAEIEARDSLPQLASDVPAGLPSELLGRRPDLVAAAADLRASAKRSDAARKDLLPSLVLNGRGSTSSDALGRLLADPQLIVWSAAASLAQTLYQGGAPSAQARAALAQNEIALNNFADLALQAFREVESALAAERSLAEQERFLNIELRQATLAESQASRDFAEGLVGILEILESQRRAVSARESMISLRSERIQSRIDLHLALGGDFETMPSNDPENKDEQRQIESEKVAKMTRNP